MAVTVVKRSNIHNLFIFRPLDTSVLQTNLHSIMYGMLEKATGRNWTKWPLFPHAAKIAFIALI